MKWYKIHLKLLGVFFLLCILYGIGSMIYYSVKKDPERHSYGFYYPYHVKSGIVTRALILRGSRNCELLLEFQKEFYDSIDQPNVTPYISSSTDTITVSINSRIELIEILCDSSAGIVKYPNRFFHKDLNKSKRNPEFREGIVGLQDLHLTPNNPPN